jgi:hypothetical protein
MMRDAAGSRWKKALWSALVVAAFTLAGCGDLYDRKDFETSVKDKSEEEVRKKVGKPVAVDSSNPERVIWTYNTTTFDSTNKNARDQKTVVVFKPIGGKLKVVEITYQ